MRFIYEFGIQVPTPILLNVDNTSAIHIALIQSITSKQNILRLTDILFVNNYKNNFCLFLVIITPSCQSFNQCYDRWQIISVYPNWCFFIGINLRGSVKKNSFKCFMNHHCKLLCIVTITTTVILPNIWWDQRLVVIRIVFLEWGIIVTKYIWMKGYKKVFQW